MDTAIALDAMDECLPHIARLDDGRDLPHRTAQASRDLASQLLRAQDDERRRIARDLHDSTCQNLLAAAWTLNQIGPHLRKRGVPLLGEAQAVLDHCMRELRTLSYLLHPPLLDECGMAPAAREYLRGFSQRSGIAVALIIAPDFGRLAPDIENILFRIVQECLTNVHRHSGSATARVRLSRANGEVAVTVSDRGCGIAPGPRDGGAGAARAGVGIASMRARVRQFGGRLIIRSGSWGTIVRAIVPVDGNDHSSAAWHRTGARAASAPEYAA